MAWGFGLTQPTVHCTNDLDPIGLISLVFGPELLNQTKLLIQPEGVNIKHDKPGPQRVLKVVVFWAFCGRIFGWAY